MRRYQTIICFVLALILRVPPVLAEPVHIRILHINDFHGFAEPYKPLGSDQMLGGITYLAARAEELRRERPSLFLAAGDMIQGNNWANLSQGESVIELMNTIGFDAMVVGNHEFDFGQAVLKKRISEARFPVLGANVQGIDSLKPYIVKEISGVRIAIIGVVTEDTPVATHPGNVSGLTFLSPEEVIAQAVRELRDRVDVILVLSHLGHHNDRALAQKLGGLDIIIGGHSHTKVLKPPVIGNTLVAQAWEHGKALGVIDLTVDNHRILSVEGRIEDIRPVAGKEHPASLAVTDKYRGYADSMLDEVIGHAAEDLDGQNVRRQETSLGDLIADIMRDVSGADATIINGGGIRTGVKKGPVQVKDIYSVLPFDNYIVAIKLTGEQIRQALEHGVSAVEQGEGRFPQVSGISFTYAPSAPPGSRIREIRVAGRPLEPGREYAVATNDFLAAGGDGYRAFGDAVRSSRDFYVIGGMMKGDKLVYSDSGTWLRDVVMDHIRRKGTIVPFTDGRIREVQQ